jgi:hypothetical protein
MTFSGHFAFAVFTVGITTNPWILLPINLGGHYLCDAVPHAEYPPLQRASWMARFFIVLDIAACCILLWWLITLPGNGGIAAAVGCIFPDLTKNITRVMAPRLDRFHEITHLWPHPFTSAIDWGRTATGRVPLSFKVAAQIGWVTLALGYAWIVI